MVGSMEAVGEHVAGPDLIVRQEVREAGVSQSLLRTCPQVTEGSLIRFHLLTDHHHAEDKLVNQ